MKLTKNGLPMIALLLFGAVVMLANLEVSDHEAQTELHIMQTDQSAAVFHKMMDVITHKRCVNCHPAGDRPRQGEDSHLHYLGVERGAEGQGFAGYSCETCHHKENNNYAGVPGAPHWGLAPKSMAWEGKTRKEIATQMMDPARNGGKNAQEILKHLTEDDLVLWAWEPGVNEEGETRESPPLSKEEWINTVKTWIAAGAIIPEK